MVRNNPPIVMAIQKNILEHISIMAQEQVQIEFIQELQQLPMLQQQAQMNPQAQQQIKSITIQIESRKAQLIAEMTKDFAEEENKLIGQYDSDPLIKR
jgi:cell division FtsZ-interacting protein ZapD